MTTLEFAENGNADACYEMGDALLKLGMYSKAAKWYRKAAYGDKNIPVWYPRHFM